ncbi:MAG: glycosyltransferase [Thiomonas sp.]
MRILLVIHQFFPEFSGGTERVTLQLARMLQHAGHAVHVLTCRSAPALQGWAEAVEVGQTWSYVHDGVPVTAIARRRLPAGAEFGFDVDAAVAAELAAWLRAKRFHIAHVMHTMRMATAVMAIQQAELPYVVTLTDFFLGCHQINLVNVRGEPCPGPDAARRCAKDCRVGVWTEPALKMRYSQAQALLAAAALRCVPSHFVQSRAEAIFPELDFRIVPHGLDLLAMLPSGTPRTPGERPGRLILAFAGTLIVQKGLHVLLDALALMPQADVELRVMGGRHGDTAYHQRIDSLIATDRRVKCLGEMNQQALFAALAECDVLCLPSLVPETFSLTFHEAAALGLPALVADHGTPAEVVSHSRAGLCVTPGDASAWAQAVQQVLDERELLAQWRSRLPMPARIEEEAFFYESLYRTVALLE